MRFLKAHQLFSGQHFLPSDTVLVINSQNILQDIVPGSSLEKSTIEHLEGIITPGFVNAHCHLELSHMKGLIAEHTGLVDFVLQVVTQRHFPEDEILAAIEKAEKQKEEVAKNVADARKNAADEIAVFKSVSTS